LDAVDLESSAGKKDANGKDRYTSAALISGLILVGVAVLVASATLEDPY